MKSRLGNDVYRMNESMYGAKIASSSVPFPLNDNMVAVVDISMDTNKKLPNVAKTPPIIDRRKRIVFCLMV